MIVPFIKDSHHQVLEAWAETSARLGRSLDLFTLDYHTDTLPAFASRLRDKTPEERDDASLALVRAVDWNNGAAVREAITRLRYDEHIDCAKKAGILRHIVIGLGCRTPQHAPHFASVLLPEDAPARELVDGLLEDRTLAAFVAHFEALRQAPLSAGDYIFDIDLDYFRSDRSARPKTHAVLDALIRHCSCLTIAREPGCVGMLRLPGEYIISADLQKHLLAHIARRG